MAFIISDNGGKSSDWKNPEPGSYIGRCIRVEDLGTQETVWEGQKKSSRKVRLAIELPNELVEWERDGKKIKEPFIVFWTLTASLGEKASMRKALENWRGRAFTADEVKHFDLDTIVGAAGTVTLTASKDGKYVNVTSIAPVMKGTACPPQVLPGWTFHLDDPNWDVYKKIGKGTRIKIANSPEFRALQLPPDIATLVLSDKQG